MPIAANLFPAVARLLFKSSKALATPGMASSGWIGLGSRISIRYSRGDFRYTRGGRAYCFKIRNENPRTARLEVEVISVNEDAEQARTIEFFTVGPNSDGGDDVNWIIARDMVSFRIKALDFID